MTIRKASLKDWEDIKRLNQELFNEGSDPSINLDTPNKLNEYYKKAASNNENYFTLICEVNFDIVGYVIADIRKCESWRNIGNMVCINNIYIEKEHRGYGYGSKMLTMIENWAKENNISEITLNTEANNKKAHAFYKKHGLLPYNIEMKKSL